MSLEFPVIDEAAAPAQDASAVAIPAVTLKAAALAHFSALEAPLRALAERYRAVAFDTLTPKGLDAAKKARNDLRENGRYAVQRAEDAFKAAANDAKKAVAPKVEELIAIVKPIEDHVHAQIVAREEQIIAEKAERDRKEAERVAAHQERLATLRGYVAQAQGLPSDRIANGIAAVEAIIIEQEAWEEFAAQAEATKAATLESLRDLHAHAVVAEEERAEAERTRAENARRQRVITALNTIQRQVSECIGKGSATITSRIEEMELAVYSEELGTEVLTAHEAAIANLRVMLAAALEREILEREVAAMRAAQAAAPAPAAPPVEPPPAVEPEPVLPLASEQETVRAFAFAAEAEPQAVEPVAEPVPPRAPSAELKRDLLELRDLAIEAAEEAALIQAFEFVEHALQPFAGKFPSQPKPGPEWWAKLRADGESLRALRAQLEQARA